MKWSMLALTLSAVTLAACETSPASPGVLPAPTSNYVCQDGTRLAVRLLGETASVSVNGAPAVDLRVTGPEGTTYSNGQQTLTIVQGQTSWAVGRAAPSPCTSG